MTQPGLAASALVLHCALFAVAQSAVAQAGAQTAVTAPAVTPAEAYQYRSVRIVAGGFITGMVPHPTRRNLMYLRTDIGGAYRSEDAGTHWTPLTDWVSGQASNLLGIESIAVDPTDPNKLYLAAGTYNKPSSPNGAVLRSTDQGRTFTIVPVPFKMGGNEDGRFAGERMAVDPNLASTLYLGTRDDGLWKSLDSGSSWARVSSFGGDSTNHIGVVFITFVRESGSAGAATPVLYAGVSTPDKNLWRSTDAGKTWAAVPGSPAGVLPNHGLISGSQLYLTYADAPGPNDMKTGAVWKLNLKKDKWSDITPEQPGLANRPPFGYGGLAVDQAHAGHLIVSTMDHWSGGDDIYRTTNAGKNWRGLKSAAIRDASLSPYLAGADGKVGIGHWIGAMMIDPYAPSHAFYGTGETVWATDDLTRADKGKPTHWHVGADGIEETAVITLVSPPVGPHLFSGLGDIGCFRHDDFDRSPAQGAMANPRMSNCSSISYAASNPLLMVRAGGAWTGTSHGARSNDGGLNWTPFQSEPPNARQGGKAAISVDGKLILWATGKGVVAVSGDEGLSWKVIEGTPERSQIIADDAVAEGFYLYDATGGTLYKSHDETADFAFTPLMTGVPANGRLAQSPARGNDSGSTMLWISSPKGLWRIADGVPAAEAIKVETVQHASAFGFGKADGDGPAALYLSGVVAGHDGLYRSVDEGNTWTDITDKDHRYGYIGVLAGDPRVFGRVYLGTNGRGVIVAEPASASTSTSSKSAQAAASAR